jgi:hypothetical protein
MPWRTAPKDRGRQRAQVVERYGITESELNMLSTYNAECARGVMHTPEWARRMAEIQGRYNARRAELNEQFARDRDS